MSTQTYDFTLTAGGSQVILAEGDYFRIMSSTGPVEVLMSEGSRYGPIAAGQGQKGKRYTRLTVRDRSGSANLGFIMVAGEEFVDNRVNGEVSVIDGEKARTLAGGMFSGSPFSAASVGNFSLCQLWNPAGSGKNLIINALSVNALAGAIVNVYTNVAMSPTDQTVTRSANKLSGAAIGVAQSRIDAVAAVPAFNNNLLQTLLAPANVTQGWGIRGGVVIRPGAGLVAINNGANAQLITNFEWFEESV